MTANIRQHFHATWEPGMDSGGVLQGDDQGWSSSPTQHCRQENSPICELPTETKLMARAYHYYHPEICNEFDI